MLSDLHQVIYRWLVLWSLRGTLIRLFCSQLEYIETIIIIIIISQFKHTSWCGSFISPTAVPVLPDNEVLVWHLRLNQGWHPGWHFGYYRRCEQMTGDMWVHVSRLALLSIAWWLLCVVAHKGEWVQTEDTPTDGCSWRKLGENIQNHWWHQSERKKKLSVACVINQRQNKGQWSWCSLSFIIINTEHRINWLLHLPFELHCW